MPAVSGIKFLKQLSASGNIVFTTLCSVCVRCDEFEFH